jgi:hypothetical protein
LDALHSAATASEPPVLSSATAPTSGARVVSFWTALDLLGRAEVYCFSGSSSDLSILSFLASTGELSRNSGQISC